MMTSNDEICKRFIENPGINPVRGGRLILHKGPYNGYIRLCEKLGYNVDHLKAEVIIPEVKVLPVIEDKSLWNWIVGDNEEPIPISYPVIRKYKLKDIEEWRRRIREISNIDINLDNFNDLQLYHLYDLYNKYFFNSALPRVTLQISTNLTKTAGKCQAIRGGKECQYTIFISKSVFSRLNLKEEQSTKSGGLECQSRLECLQLVLEHEMIHLAIQIHYPDAKAKDQKIYSSHGALFKDLVYAYFGQTKSTHQIGSIIENDEDEEPLTKGQIQIGTIVSFLSKNILRKGVVVDAFPKNAIVTFLNGDNLKINYDFLNKVNENDEDYPALLKIKDSLDKKLHYLNRLNIGDKIKYQDRDQVVENTVYETYPRSNAVGVRSGNYIYKIRYSYLILPSSIPISTPTFISNNKVLSKNDFKVGDKVRTNNGGKVVTGTIIKKNPVNAVVRDEQNREWSINYNILDII